ncbi:MAG: primosomal replication protein N [Duodenibacillus sp.]|nr:primosomal replication protein N [Duodenibacillus sp.]
MTGVLLEKSALRYTPAGVPVFEAKMHHASALWEAGAQRKVEFDFEVIAFADAALRLDGVREGSPVAMQGFIAPRSIRSARLTVHVTEFTH